MNEELISFAMYLTGHNRDTIIGLYNGWTKNCVDCFGLGFCDQPGASAAYPTIPCPTCEKKESNKLGEKAFTVIV